MRLLDFDLVCLFLLLKDGALAVAIMVIDGSKKTYFVETVHLSRGRVLLKSVVRSEIFKLNQESHTDFKFKLNGHLKI